MEREIDAATRIPMRFSDACHRLEDPTTVLPSTVVAPLGGGTVVEQDVMLQIGALQVEPSAAGMAVSWTPEGHEKLLPSFRGRLVLVPDSLSGTRISLQGTYTVPLGPVGRFGDSVVGRRVARASIADLLERVAHALGAGHPDGGAAGSGSIAPTVGLQERGPTGWTEIPSEHFIG